MAKRGAKGWQNLNDCKYIRRDRGRWQITETGRVAVESETNGFSLTQTQSEPLNHQDIQQMIVEIGAALGFYAETEYQFYDVIWRETRVSPRISHVFEVQSKGNIDSAFAKLKRAFDTQRSKPFLILDSERDTNRGKISRTRIRKSGVITISVLSNAKTFRKLHAIADFCKILRLVSAFETVILLIFYIFVKEQ